MFNGFLTESIIKRAVEKEIVDIKIHNLRDFTTDKHRSVDDTPYGGGAGMVMKAEPIVKCLEFIEKEEKGIKILLTPSGEKFNEKTAVNFSKENKLILICGHYEGFDERIKKFIDIELSIGDYVLTGGEIPAAAVIDAVVRLLPGVLGNKDSAANDSFMNGVLDFPHYTKPRVFRGLKVPEALLSGNHKKIDEWRVKKSLKVTAKKRPDLLKK